MRRVRWAFGWAIAGSLIFPTLGIGLMLSEGPLPDGSIGWHSSQKLLIWGYLLLTPVTWTLLFGLLFADEKSRQAFVRVAGGIPLCFSVMVALPGVQRLLAGGPEGLLLVALGILTWWNGYAMLLGPEQSEKL